jgi:cytochrome c
MERDVVRKLLAIVTITAAAGSLSIGTASAQDAAKGEQVFKQCQTCHRADKNLVGPALGGVVGRKVGTAASYNYTATYPAAGAAGLVWTEAELDNYLQGPAEYIKKYLTDKGQPPAGTTSKMVFKLTDAGQRKDVIAYLKTLKP